jgi:hypothetical protein
MKESIFNIVKERQDVTFKELSREIPGFKGNTHMSLGTESNVLLWHALSAEAYQALKELLNEDRIFFHPASLMAYEIDGGSPDLPTTDNPLKAGGYKQPRWFPVCFFTYPHGTKK